MMNFNNVYYILCIIKENILFVCVVFVINDFYCRFWKGFFGNYLWICDEGFKE